MPVMPPNDRELTAVNQLDFFKTDVIQEAYSSVDYE